MGLSTGSGWSLQLWNGPGPGLPITNQCFAGHFAGTQFADIACDTGFAGGSWALSFGSATGFMNGVNGNYWNGGPGPPFPVTAECFAADFNGDGKTDLACYLGNGSNGQNAGVWGITVSYGNGW
jgi:FG-GAP repeat